MCDKYRLTVIFLEIMVSKSLFIKNFYFSKILFPNKFLTIRIFLIFKLVKFLFPKETMLKVQIAIPLLFGYSMKINRFIMYI